MSEVRQRWRIVFARGEDARYLSHLDAVRSWERAFRRGEIPVATSEGFSPRSKLVFAAPLQLGMLAEHELADLYLAERLTAPGLRARLAESMPKGYTVVELHDVWTGAPALAPRLVAADYRMTLLNVERARLESAVQRLLAMGELPRERRKESRVVRYDLRPLLLDLRAGPPDTAAAAAASPTQPPSTAGMPVAAAGVWMRLRHSQNRGSGRPDEVVAALAAELGMRPMSLAGAGDDADTANAPADDVTPPVDAAADAPTVAESSEPRLETIRQVRERLWLDDELA
jgi:radical SAM-linked protein